MFLKVSAFEVAFFSLDRPDRDFLVGKSLVEQHADNVGLESESARVRMPTHDVIAKVNGEPVVVMKAKAADQIHQP